MGWGMLRLITDTGDDPRELLQTWALGAGYPLEVNDDSDYTSAAEGRWVYLLETDCSLTMYCIWCGERQCAGCGSRQDVAIYGRMAAVSCTRPECQERYNRLLHEVGLLDPGRKLIPMAPAAA